MQKAIEEETMRCMARAAQFFAERLQNPDAVQATMEVVMAAYQLGFSHGEDLRESQQETTLEN